jgi:hypothetical protein
MDRRFVERVERAIRGRTLLDNIKENLCETDLGGRSRQIQARRVVVGVMQIRCPGCRV